MNKMELEVLKQLGVPNQVLVHAIAATKLDAVLMRATDEVEGARYDENHPLVENRAQMAINALFPIMRRYDPQYTPRMEVSTV